MLKYEYIEVSRLSVDELNEFGAQGWQACALQHEDTQVSSWVHSKQPGGWTGLLMRQVQEESQDEETQDDDSKR